MTYSVKEIFFTLQGEGAQAGRAAVFCRFAGCNLWSGLERDRESARCTFCDTDFVGCDGPGGGKFPTAAALADAIDAQWGDRGRGKLVVCTGGEPLLQLDEALVGAVHGRGFSIAVETNGTITPPRGIDWLCVSPKGANPLSIRRGQELKVVFPQPELDLELLSTLEFDHFFIQPMDGPDWVANTRAAVAYCLRHPQWRLGLQTHKYLNIP